jgi:ribonuclease HII
MLSFSYETDSKLFETQVGIDEVGRGCFAGPVVAAGVVWDTRWLNDSDNEMLKQIKDSKKVSHKKRKILSDFIKKHSLFYAISFVDEKIIDEINILKATHMAMHNVIDDINSKIYLDRLLVDGSNFKVYVSKCNALVNKKGLIKETRFTVPHVCVPNGDNTYINIAAASIIAKVARDEYMEKLCEDDPILQEKYDWKNNKGYGTKKHIQGIEQLGITPHHRKTFGMCKTFIG